MRHNLRHSLNILGHTLYTVAVRYVWVHVCMVALTALCVLSGADWAYFRHVALAAPRALLFTADVVGLLLPLFFLLFYVKRYLLHSLPTPLQEKIHGINLAIISAFGIALFYKALSGRSSPDHHTLAHDAALVDNSYDFHFGFMQGEMLGGWPSSHTAVAFAMASYIVAASPEKKYMPYLMYTYATLIGLGVSLGFHWLSEVLAGAMLGMVVGRAVWYTTRT